MSAPAVQRPYGLAPMVALLVFLLSLAWSFRDLAGADLADTTPLPTVLLNDVLLEDGGKLMRLSQGLDERFVIWAIARNARTWLRAPLDMFEAETCYPAPSSLALGEPMLTLGLLGVPAWIVTGDPIATFNFVVLLIPILSALAMFWLVRRWTGNDAAGIVAGVVYAFHVIKIGNISHPYAGDTAWTVFAIVFFERWLESGRWRDVIGLGLAIALQIGGSIYPLIGALVIGSIVGVHAILRLGVRRTRPLQWALLALGVGLVAYGAFAPFLTKGGDGSLSARTLRVFMPWESLVPGESGWFGLVIVLGGAAAFLPTRSKSGAGGGAFQWPLALCIFFTLWLATGGNAGDRYVAEMRGVPGPAPLPNLYDWLGAVVPVLQQVRAPVAISGGIHLSMSALVGVGIARLLERVPPARSRQAAVVVVVVATLYTLRVGLPDVHSFYPAEMQPGKGLLAFWRELEVRGNSGPALELPVEDLGPGLGSMSVLMSAYHHRPTSRCYNSFTPEEVVATTEWASRLPDREAIGELEARGFTTVVIHHPPARRDLHAWRAKLQAEAASPGARLALVHEDPVRSAYAIVPDGTGAEPPDAGGR